MPEKRDLGLDFLKGIGCVLMVVAHSKLKMWNYEQFIFWGSLAPALFFTVTGITASFQAKKYSPRTVTILYIFILLLGFSYNGFLGQDFIGHVEFEIIQTIALGALAVYFVARFIDPPVWAYAVLGFASFGLDKLILFLLQGREVTGLTGILISPGHFPFIPWLSLFFLGVFAYRVRNLYNLLGALIFGALYYFMFGMRVMDLTESKWQFLSDFFIASVIFLFFSFFIVRAVQLFSRPKINWLVMYWGKYSLLFLYVHYGFVNYFRSLKIQHEVELIWNHPFLFWLLVLSLTTALMFAITFSSHWFEPIFHNIFIWIALVVLVFAVPLVLPNQSFIEWSELGLGIIFATFYPVLSQTLKHQEIHELHN
jgi:hypothetical protein